MPLLKGKKKWLAVSVRMRKQDSIINRMNSSKSKPTYISAKGVYARFSKIWAIFSLLSGTRNISPFTLPRMGALTMCQDKFQQQSLHFCFCVSIKSLPCSQPREQLLYGKRSDPQLSICLSLLLIKVLGAPFQVAKHACKDKLISCEQSRAWKPLCRDFHRDTLLGKENASPSLPPLLPGSVEGNWHLEESVNAISELCSLENTASGTPATLILAFSI